MPEHQQNHGQGDTDLIPAQIVDQRRSVATDGDLSPATTSDAKALEETPRQSASSDQGSRATSLATFPMTDTSVQDSSVETGGLRMEEGGQLTFRPTNSVSTRNAEDVLTETGTLTEQASESALESVPSLESASSGKADESRKVLLEIQRMMQGDVPVKNIEGKRSYKLGRIPGRIQEKMERTAFTCERLVYPLCVLRGDLGRSVVVRDTLMEDMGLNLKRHRFFTFARLGVIAFYAFLTVLLLGASCAVGATFARCAPVFGDEADYKAGSLREGNLTIEVEWTNPSLFWIGVSSKLDVQLVYKSLDGPVLGTVECARCLSSTRRDGVQRSMILLPPQSEPTHFTLVGTNLTKIVCNDDALAFLQFRDLLVATFAGSYSIRGLVRTKPFVYPCEPPPPTPQQDQPSR